MMTLHVRSRPEGAPRPRDADPSEDGQEADRRSDGHAADDAPVDSTPGDDDPVDDDPAEEASRARGPGPARTRSSRFPRAVGAVSRARAVGSDHHAEAVTALVVAIVALGLAALSVLIFAAVSGPSAAAAAGAASVVTGGSGGPGGTGTGSDPAAGGDGLVGPALLMGRVTDVPDPGTVVVAVQNRSVPVSVVGVDFSTTPSCAAASALGFARQTLVGQTVTLVPDATQPATTPTGARRAYVVLPSQFSYTDAALTAGWAVAADGQYRAVFEREVGQAQDDRAGMWGPPCRRRP